MDVDRDVGDRPGIGYICLALATMLKDKGDQKAAMALAQETSTIFIDVHVARKAAEARVLIRQLAL